MASNIMHIAMSKIIKEKLNLSDKFISASILPDIIKYNTSDRKTSHYESSYKIKEFLPGITDFDKFIKENINKYDEDIFLGYYAHLIQDEIFWQEYFSLICVSNEKDVLIYIADNSKYSKTEFCEMINMDYTKLNKYLMSIYNLNANEIDTFLKKHLKEYNPNKFIDEHNVFLKQELAGNTNFLTKEFVEEYMNIAINECIKRIENFKKEK